MNTTRIRTRRLDLGAAFFMLCLGVSCGGPNMNPPADRARAALEASLNAWKNGKKPGMIEGTDPPVQAADNEWTNGKKLAGFEILGEKASDSDKRFTVKLKHDAPAAGSKTGPTEVEAVYVVLGANPIAVFRQEDYERTLNMDNNPVEKRKKR